MITLVLLPGMDGTGTLFDPFVEMLGARFNVKVVRYPATEPMGYAELEAVARAQLPTEGPFVILGVNTCVRDLGSRHLYQWIVGLHFILPNLRALYPCVAGPGRAAFFL